MALSGPATGQLASQQASQHSPQILALRRARGRSLIRTQPGRRQTRVQDRVAARDRAAGGRRLADRGDRGRHAGARDVECAAGGDGQTGLVQPAQLGRDVGRALHEGEADEGGVQGGAHVRLVVQADPVQRDGLDPKGRVPRRDGRDREILAQRAAVLDDGRTRTARILDDVGVARVGGIALVDPGGRDRVAVDQRSGDLDGGRSETIHAPVAVEIGRGIEARIPATRPRTASDHDRVASAAFAVDIGGRRDDVVRVPRVELGRLSAHRSSERAEHQCRRQGKHDDPGEGAPGRRFVRSPHPPLRGGIHRRGSLRMRSTLVIFRGTACPSACRLCITRPAHCYGTAAPLDVADPP